MWSLVVPIVSLPALGCDSSTEPRPPTAAFYVLTAVAGDPLPTELVTTDFVRVTVLSEGPQSITTPTHYRITANRVEIDFDCPPGADCVAPPHLAGSVLPTACSSNGGPTSWAANR